MDARATTDLSRSTEALSVRRVLCAGGPTGLGLTLLLRRP